MARSRAICPPRLCRPRCERRRCRTRTVPRTLGATCPAGCGVVQPGAIAPRADRAQRPVGMDWSRLLADPAHLHRCVRASMAQIGGPGAGPDRYLRDGPALPALARGGGVAALTQLTDFAGGLDVVDAAAACAASFRACAMHTQRLSRSGPRRRRSLLLAATALSRRRML